MPEQRSIRLWALLPLTGFVILVGIFAISLGSGRDPRALPSALIDRPAPDFSLPPVLEGKPGLARADLDGKPALVNFFASWCAPCREEQPTLTGLAATGRIALYGIAYKNQPDEARAFLASDGDPYSRIGQDLAGRTAIDFGVYGVPETYLVDPKGRIRFRYAGALTQDVLDHEILPRLAAIEHEAK